MPSRLRPTAGGIPPPAPLGALLELTAQEVWARCCEAARERIPPQSYRTWLEGTTATALSGNELVVEARDRFHADWIEDKFGPLLAAAARSTLGLDLTIRATAREELSPIPAPALELHLGESPSGPPVAPGAPSPAPRSLPSPHLNERYSFEAFVVGTNNQLAHAACEAVAEKPARMYNPLFLYGGVGLGQDPSHACHRP